MNDATGIGKFQMCCCEATLLREIADKRLRRKDIAQTYRLAMESDERHYMDWFKVNQAIIERWSVSGLQWIKVQAHSGKCFQIEQEIEQ